MIIHNIISYVVTFGSFSDGELVIVRFCADGEVVPFADALSPGSRRWIPVVQDVVIDFDSEPPTAAFRILVHLLEAYPELPRSVNVRKPLEQKLDVPG